MVRNMAEEKVAGNIAEENKKSWFARNKILSGFLIFFIALIIIEGIYLAGNKMPNALATEVKNGYSCPELSNMKLLDYNSKYGSWMAETENYSTATEEITYGYVADIDGKSVVYCQIGDEKGKNTSYVYCGDAMKYIQLNVLDSKGAVTKKIGIQVIFNKSTKEYVKTECEKYELIQD